MSHIGWIVLTGFILRIEVAGVSSIEWHPKNQTTLLVSTVEGQWGLIENVIFESKKKKAKTAAADPLAEVQRQENSLKFLLDDEADEDDEGDDLDQMILDDSSNQ